MATVVILQFSGSTDKWIPEGVSFVNDETFKQSNDRHKTSGNGQVALTPHEQVSVSGLADYLHDAGYHVTNVFRQMRKDRKQVGRKYHMLRYVLLPGDEALDSLGTIRENYETVEDDLVDLLNDSYWRVRAYRNHQENGDIMLSINFEARVPRFNSGKPIMVYERDEAGKKVGEAKPIAPKTVLKMNPGALLEIREATVAMAAEAVEAVEVAKVA